MSAPFRLDPERPADAPVVEGLVARAFGPGRFAKAAERLREGSAPILPLSFVAWVDDRALGCVRMWPIAIGETAALLLGPFAVEAEERGSGIGAALIRRACEAAAAAGHSVVLLVGDMAYFGELGFEPARSVALPGPVDQRRVLARGLTPGALEGLGGMARIAPPAIEVAHADSMAAE